MGWWDHAERCSASTQSLQLQESMHLPASLSFEQGQQGQKCGTWVGGKDRASRPALPISCSSCSPGSPRATHGWGMLMPPACPVPCFEGFSPGFLVSPDALEQEDR